MALYFDHKIQNVPNGSIHMEVAWYSHFPILAIASYSEEKGGFVLLYSEQGDLLDSHSIPEHPSSQVTCISWHPHKKLLCVGWEDGELVVWNEQDHLLQEVQPSQHHGAISLMEWSERGTRLVSGDVYGAVVGWKCDCKGVLQAVFHHELKDPICQGVFRSPTIGTDTVDVSGLARAAVSGDEYALDMFSTWRPKTGVRRFSTNVEAHESIMFYVGAVSGVVYYVIEDGSCNEVMQIDGAVKKFLYHNAKDMLVVVSDSLVVGQFQLETDGSFIEISKVKLSGRLQDSNIIWAGSGIMAVSTGDINIRIWNLDEGDNYVLSSKSTPFNDNAEHITCMDYWQSKGILCCGTNLGIVILWELKSSVIEGGGEQNWSMTVASNVHGTIKHIKWGNDLLVVNTVREVYILKEQILCAHYRDQVSGVQQSPNSVCVNLLSNSEKIEVKTDIQIKGVSVTVDHLLVWSGRKVAVYEITATSMQCRLVGTFNCESDNIGLHDQSVFIIEGGVVQIRTFQGTMKQTLTFLEIEGIPITLDICNSYLTVATSFGYLKLWELTRREAKPHANPRNLMEMISDLGEVMCARSNTNGSKVALTIANSNFLPDCKLYVWDVESDGIVYFNFASGKKEEDDVVVPPNSAQSHTRTYSAKKGRSQSDTSYSISGRVVISHWWDTEEPKLLVCEAKLLNNVKSNNKKAQIMPSMIFANEKEQKMEKPDTLIVTMYNAAETGMIVQDTFPLTEEYSRVLGLQIPYCYLLKKPEDAKEKNSDSGSLVVGKILRDFVGLESTDKATCEAMINFSFHLSVGNMDDAFKAIRTIKSESVWESMARMCVKTRRLDVASVCLGNMGHVRGARALRLAKKEPQVEVQVAILAVYLGMMEEAENLFSECGRYDLLNKLYRDSGQWEKALEVAEQNDRIHLRTTCYQYAKHLEGKGDLTGSISMYEKSETHRFEVPRMLFDDPQLLETYVLKNKDIELQKWWAQYLESTGEMESALQYYESAQDYLSLVRVHCYCENLEKAAEIANDSGDKAACYHLARQYENVDNVKMAIHFFTRAQAYGNAIRICKEQSLDEQLWNMALLGGPEEQLDAARYLEKCERPNYERSIMLYHKAGYLGKAVDLAFKTQQYSALQYVALDLDATSDPALLQQCAQFFVENGQYTKAVDMLAAGKQVHEALDLCMEHNIPVTEELSDVLSEKAEGETRNQLLEKVAECCFLQGNYHLATKKFTQSGNKVKAMKALLKSGDTEKVVYFANVSRQRDMYIMAANYLQTVDWQSNPDIIKNIIGFYTKGRALDRLAGFYESCAQVEIDEYQNYDKAMGALNEAQKAMSNAANLDDGESRLMQIQMKLQLVSKFAEIKRLYTMDPDESLSQCRKLLESHNIDMIIRRGDVYAFMIEHNVKQQSYQTAYSLVEEMKNQYPNTSLTYFIKTMTLESIAKAINIPMTGKGNIDESEEEIQEEVHDY